MKRIVTIFSAAGLIALAGCSPMNAAKPGPGRGFGPGAGPGMMWGGGGPGYGYGSGPWMMGSGYGPMGGGMMGQGMMGVWGGGLPADLSAEQRTRIAEIQREARTRQWPLMQQMHELMWNDGAPFDEQAQRRDYDRVASLHRQMFENMLESRKRIDAVLTPQQRDQLRRGVR